MTPVELEILSKPRVQRFIREKMGKIRVGDLLSVAGEDAVVYSEVPATSRQGRRIYIRYINRDSNDNCIAQDFEEDVHTFYLRVPLAIDHRNPKRGLWGMIDWNKWKINEWYTDKNSMCIESKELCWSERNDEPVHFTGTPYLALLKALEAQIGEEDGQD